MTLALTKNRNVNDKKDIIAIRQHITSFVVEIRIGIAQT